MFFGFIQSIIFHISIIFSLFFFANFFNPNRNQIYTEIPIEIVEISKETSIKKVSKKKVEEKKPTFLPPQPKPKPKPPEFSEKKIIKKKTKKKKEVKEDRLASILKSIENISKNKYKTDSEDKKETEKNIESKISSDKVSISEKDLIRRQFASCWNPPSGSKNIDKLQVLIKLTLNEEGNVVNAKLIGGGNMSDPFYRSAAERAMRAVRHPSCKKVKVPSKKYESWKNMTLNFDPIIMQGLKQ